MGRHHPEPHLGTSSVRTGWADFNPLFPGRRGGDRILTVPLQRKVTKATRAGAGGGALLLFACLVATGCGEGGVEQRADVKLGLEGDDNVEIEQGVTEGQVVFGQ